MFVADRLRLAALALLAAAPAACTQGSTAYPSLAERPIETRGFPAIAPAPAPAAAPDPAVAGRVAALEQGSIDADRAFQVALPEARALTARAGAAGGESWVVAQQALSALEAIRARGRGDLPALDDMQRDLLASGDPAKIAAAGEVAAVAKRIAAREVAQSDTLSALEAKLDTQGTAGRSGT